MGVIIRHIKIRYMASMGLGMHENKVGLTSSFALKQTACKLGGEGGIH